MDTLKSLSELDWQREWSRDYPAIEVPFGGKSVQLRAGDGNIANIRGWAMVFGFVGGEVAKGQEIVATLVLKYPQKGNIEYRVDDFDTSQGGTIFIPWPRVTVWFRDRNPPKKDQDHEPSQVVVSFVPALSDETVAPGFQSLVYGRSAVPLENEPCRVDVPKGATSYRVMVNFTGSSESTTETSRSYVVVEERSENVLWSRYAVEDRHLPLLIQQTAQWERTPPGPKAHLQLKRQKVESSGKVSATVFWQYDLGGYR